MWEADPINARTAALSLGDPGINGFGGIGGVEGAREEDVEDEGDMAPAKVVAEEGADIGSSRDIYLAPSQALSSSSVVERGIDIEPPCECSEV